jgi:hypothetical protein
MVKEKLLSLAIAAAERSDMGQRHGAVMFSHHGKRIHIVGSNSSDTSCFSQHAEEACCILCHQQYGQQCGQQRERRENR